MIELIKDVYVHGLGKLASPEVVFLGADEKEKHVFSPRPMGKEGYFDVGIDLKSNGEAVVTFKRGVPARHVVLEYTLPYELKTFETIATPYETIKHLSLVVGNEKEKVSDELTEVEYQWKLNHGW